MQEVACFSCVPTVVKGIIRKKNLKTTKNIRPVVSFAGPQDTFVRIRKCHPTLGTLAREGAQSLAGSAQARLQSALSFLPRVLFSEQPTQW